MWIYKIRKIFQTSCFLNNFFTVKYKKNPALCYRAGFLNYYFQQLEFSITRSTWERYHITNIGHTGNKQQQPLKTKSKTRMRT